MTPSITLHQIERAMYRDAEFLLWERSNPAIVARERGIQAKRDSKQYQPNYTPPQAKPSRRLKGPIAGKCEKCGEAFVGTHKQRYCTPDCAAIAAKEKGLERKRQARLRRRQQRQEALGL